MKKLLATLLIAGNVHAQTIPGRTSTVEVDTAVKAASDAPYHHWVACDMTLYQCLESLNTCRQQGTTLPPTDTPPASPGNGCLASHGTENDFQDGAGGGALWKPESEGVPNGAPAILLPIEYCSANLILLDSAGNKVSGIQRTKCGGNGNRAHFWASKRAAELKQHAPITVKVEVNGKTECRIVPDPTRRYD